MWGLYFYLGNTGATAELGMESWTAARSEVATHQEAQQWQWDALSENTLFTGSLRGNGSRAAMHQFQCLLQFPNTVGDEPY